MGYITNYGNKGMIMAICNFSLEKGSRNIFLGHN